MRRDVRRKAEQITRMLWAGYGPTRTAKLMGTTYDGVLRITKTPEFQAIDREVRGSVIGRMDASREKIRQEMEDALPEAVRVLLQNVREKHELKAALEVLDRDPARQFAKGAHAASQTTTNLGVQVRIDSQALAQAIADAKRTHEVMEKASRVKPTDA
jgi:hypothetical protein